MPSFREWLLSNGYIDPGRLEDAELDRVSQEPGTIVAERYRIISTLGTGHYGVVYRAEDVSLQKEVALKMLNITDAGSTALLRFQKEARAAAKLKHTNIVTVLDFRLDDKNNFYLVLELIEGMSLRALIRSHGTLAPDECLPLFLQILSGLSHAHQSNVVHRDLNPNNILVDFRHPQQPIAKIVDFGLAFLTDEDQRLTREGVAVGTPEFMSPEQCHGQNIDARTDIYSFGCLMFDALTGRPPHQRDTVVDTIMCHVNIDAPTLEEACPGVVWPPQLSDIVARALKRDPDERFQSVDELADALRAIPIEPHAVEVEKKQETIKQPNTVTNHPTSFRTFLNSVPLSVVVAFTAIVAIAVVVVSFGNDIYDKIGSLQGIEHINKIPADKIANANKPGNRAVKRKSKSEPPKSEDAQSHADKVMCSLMAGGDPDNTNPLDEVSESALLPTRGVAGSYDLFAGSHDASMKLAEGRKYIAGLRVRNPYGFQGPGLRYLKGLKIESLEIRKSAMTDQSLAENMPFMPKLRRLMLGSHPTLKGSYFKTLASKMPELQSLDLGATGLNDEGLRQVKYFKKLEFLNIGKCHGLTGATLHELSSLKHLRDLHASGASIMPKYWSCLYSFPSLERVSVVYSKFAADDLQVFRKTRVQLLFIGYSDLTDEGLSVLAKAPKLRAISVESCKNITAKGIESLLASTITEFDCSGIKSSPELIDVLGRWKNLRQLRMNSCGLTAPEAAKILEGTKIKFLEVGMPITQEQAQRLQRQFAGLTIKYTGGA
jgi:serine/threonine protein kinase